MEETKKTCDICKLSTNLTSDVLIVGDWLEHQNITVHYFCLLLSSNLPQSGKIGNGILGFLFRDINKEIKAAAERVCCYCNANHASVCCFVCKDYFHVRCGYQNESLFHFSDDFRSYCDQCAPQNELQAGFMKTLGAKGSERRCDICHCSMGDYRPRKWVYGECCGNGFAHIICMRKYALQAGYYLKCIWCRHASFRDLIRKQGVFVPNRDAGWEREPLAFDDLHRGHGRCDMQECLCPRGRECDWGKWCLIRCALCGSFGAHNPFCITGNISCKEKIKEFICTTCQSTKEQRKVEDTNIVSTENTQNTLYVPKQLVKGRNEVYMSETPSFSGGESQNQSQTHANAAVPETQEAVKYKQPITPNTTQHQISIPTDDPMYNNSIINLCTQTINVTIPSVDDTTSIEEIVQEVQMEHDDQVEQENQIRTDHSYAEKMVQHDESNVQSDDKALVDFLCAQVMQDPAIRNYRELFPATSESNSITFGAFQFDANTSKCVGQCKVRVDPTDPRIAGLRLEEIKNTPLILLADDVVESVSDAGPFARIEEILNEYSGLG